MAKKRGKRERTKPDPRWAARVRALRVDVLGMTQEDFAQRLGVTRRALVAWETAATAVPGPVQHLIRCLERTRKFLD